MRVDVQTGQVLGARQTAKGDWQPPLSTGSWPSILSSHAGATVVVEDLGQPITLTVKASATFQFLGSAWASHPVTRSPYRPFYEVLIDGLHVNVSRDGKTLFCASLGGRGGG
jgi:hypothetical protein